MEIRLYTTSSPNNKLEKTLENEKIFDCKMKQYSDILYPLINLFSPVPLNYNYAYIPQYERYYFIDNVEYMQNNIYNLHLSVDVLQTYKDEILASKVKIKAQTEYNNFYNDGSYENLETFESDVYSSNVALEKKEHLIMVTMGG